MCENNECEMYEGTLSWTPDESPYVVSTDSKQQRVIDAMRPKDRKVLADKLGFAAAGYVFRGKKTNVHYNGNVWKICWDGFVRNHHDGIQ